MHEWLKIIVGMNPVSKAGRTRSLRLPVAAFGLLAVGVALSVAPRAAPPVLPIKPDRAAIERQLSQMLDMKNEVKDPVFVRWQQPIRYYLHGLEGEPALEKLFEAQAARIARLTGLNISRHRELHLAYKDESRNERHRWPGGLPTTAAIFFSADMDKSFRDPRVINIIKAFGDDPDHERKRYMTTRLRVASQKDDLLLQKRGFGQSGLVFYFLLQNVSQTASKEQGVQRHAALQVELLQALMNMICRVDNSDYVPSILNGDPYARGIHDLTDFDKALLKAYYSPELPAVTTKRKALRIMTSIIMRELEATTR